MEPNRDGWDPEHPDIKRASGVPKEGAGTKGLLVAIGIALFMLGVWFFRK